MVIELQQIFGVRFVHEDFPEQQRIQQQVMAIVPLDFKLAADDTAVHSLADAPGRAAVRKRSP
jgi:hypothetical protein